MGAVFMHTECRYIFILCVCVFGQGTVLLPEACLRIPGDFHLLPT